MLTAKIRLYTVDELPPAGRSWAISNQQLIWLGNDGRESTEEEALEYLHKEGFYFHGDGTTAFVVFAEPSHRPILLDFADELYKVEEENPC